MLSKLKKLMILSASIALIVFSKTYKSSNSYLNKDTSSKTPPALVSIISLGHKISVSYFYWFSSTIHVGTAIFNKESIKYFYDYAKIITKLNPKHKAIYSYVASGLIDAPNMEDLKTLKIGVDTYPDDWRISLFYSLLLIEKKQDFKTASNLMYPFSKKDDAPEYIKNLYRSYLAKLKPTKEQLLIYTIDYHSNSSAILKKGLKNKISMLGIDTLSVHNILNSKKPIEIQFKKLLAILPR